MSKQPTRTITVSRWKQLANEITQTAKAIEAGTIDHDEASQRVGRLALREAMAMGIHPEAVVGEKDETPEERMVKPRASTL